MSITESVGERNLKIENQLTLAKLWAKVGCPVFSLKGFSQFANYEKVE